MSFVSAVLFILLDKFAARQKKARKVKEVVSINEEEAPEAAEAISIISHVDQFFANLFFIFGGGVMLITLKLYIFRGGENLPVEFLVDMHACNFILLSGVSF